MENGKQYSSAVVKQMIKDVQPIPCPASKVQIVSKEDNLIVIHGVAHAGTIPHGCSLGRGHEAPRCKCECGFEWVKFHNEV